ncbi:MAG: hypothetical protein AAGD25_14365 [Cyanobacteria bacterium P01_F01_bin.150]
MSRYIECEIDGKSKIVYKYLSSQPCEACRIYEEFGIGKYHFFWWDYEDAGEDEGQPCYKYLPTRQGADGDVLILNRENLEALSSCLETLKADVSQAARYIWMIEAICDFMLKHPHQEEFTFESEF